MIVHLERDSVAMGDDALAPHPVDWEVSDGFTVGQLARRIRWLSYPATIVGGRATWVLVRTEPGERDGLHLAVLAQQWRRPRWLVDPKTPIRDGSLRFRLLYRTQQDPDEVFTELSTGPEFFERRGWFG